ncbi:hypothetical protein MSCT144_06480 [Mycoplasma mycoides subsp. mycoides]|nr:prolipoprotein [Mycoplasma mycoides subsp. mycoides]AMK56544.1 hypothetical protein MSCT144_06480 [Mycoplasma mycoides subsp. mycoides]
MNTPHKGHYMKKLLTIFGSISLISMTSITSIACKNINKSKKEDPSKPDRTPKTPENDSTKPEENQPKKPDDKKPNNNDNSSNDSNSNSNPNNKPDSTKPSENPKKPNEQHQGDDPNNHQPQADQLEKSEQPKRTKEQNFELIKKYGAEVLALLESLSEDKTEQLYKKPENSELLKLVTNIGQFYQKLGSSTTIDDFEKEFKEKKFLNKLYEEWDKTVTEYEKQKDSILEILKQ